MSYQSAKGYRAEAAVEKILSARNGECYRPRAGRSEDFGDIGGFPLVVSIKDRARLELSEWVDEMNDAVVRSPWATGIVWHKRRGQGNPERWYVTTTGALFLPFFDAYCMDMERELNPRRIVDVPLP